jgi:DNA (cytosine-5)-methyltransferase 1
MAELDSAKSNGVKVMTTFSCGGGSSMGYKLAGCTVLAANDIDKEMAWHYKLNLKPKHYFLCPVKDLATMDLPPELIGIDILDGSPPCSTFSTSGRREKDWGKKKHFREGQTEQVLDDLFFQFLDAAQRIQPKVIIAENVKGMLMGNAKGYTRAITERLRSMGYRPQIFLINSADCGVPQKRERVFFCAVRSDVSTKLLELEPCSRWISVGEACADLVATPDENKLHVLTTLEQRLWQCSKPGEAFARASERFTGKTNHFNRFRLKSTSPCPTMTATVNYTHWSECRTMTYRESLRIGSFPDDYVARTSAIGKYMIGMSVPPRMMETVARAVCKQWLGVSNG